MKTILRFVVILLLFSCSTAQPEQTPTVGSAPVFESTAAMMDWVRNPTKDYVMVVAHRGYWRSAPENSMLAVRNAVGAGIDIVELDVRKTLDGQFFLLLRVSLEARFIQRQVLPRSPCNLTAVRGAFFNKTTNLFVVVVKHLS